MSYDKWLVLLTYFKKQVSIWKPQHIWNGGGNSTAFYEYIIACKSSFERTL